MLSLELTKKNNGTFSTLRNTKCSNPWIICFYFAFVYQITLKGNGTQGYHVMRNKQDALLACYSNNLMLQDDNKTSCFTMGVFKLEKNDQISIKHVSTSGIRAVFTSNASFFGLVRLGKFNKRGVVTSVQPMTPRQLDRKDIVNDI